MVKLIGWTMMLFNLIPLVDDKSYEEVTFEKMKDVLDKKEIFEFLEEKFKDKIDLSWYSSEAKEEISKKLWDIYSGYLSSERRKFGVEKNGIALLMVYVLQALQDEIK